MKIRYHLVLFALVLASCAPLAPAAPIDPVYAASPADWGPVGASPEKVATLSARSPAYLDASDSGWYAQADGNYYAHQCNILVDAVPAGYPGGCLYRVSAMCVQAGVGFVRGYSQQDAPIATPLLIALYQPPLITPAGYLEINHLAAEPYIGLNGPPTWWHRAAPYTGGWCAPAAYDRK